LKLRILDLANEFPDITTKGFAFDSFQTVDHAFSDAILRQVLDLKGQLFSAVRVVLLLNAVLEDADPLVRGVVTVLQAQNRRKLRFLANDLSLSSLTLV
jgi:hypothetical protein